MGFMDHHAIVVTGCRPEHVAEAYTTALYLDCRPSEITPRVINGHTSFFIPPDGSKEGWEDSDTGDARREKFIHWLRESYSRDVYLEWCSVVFGRDAARAKVDAHPWDGAGGGGEEE